MVGFWTKAILTVLVVVVGAPSLPLTAGTSGAIIIGAVFAIWGVDWSGSGGGSSGS